MVVHTNTRKRYVMSLSFGEKKQTFQDGNNKRISASSGLHAIKKKSVASSINLHPDL